MAEKKQKKYDENSIKTLSGLEHIRLRPNLYLTNIDDMFMEAFLNALDEALSGFGNKIKIKLHKNGAWSCQDFGRGLPIKKIDDIFLKINTSGKFDADAYQLKNGQNGIGVKLLVSLSEYVKVKTQQNGEVWEAEYRDVGKKNKLAHKTGKCAKDETGTYIEFKTDDEFWKGKTINKELVRQHCLETSYVMKNLIIEYEDEIDKIKETYQAKDGIINYISDRYDSKKLICDNIYLPKTKLPNGEEAEIVFNWTSNDKTDVIYFTNMLKMIELGTGYDGFVQGLYDTLQNFANQNKDEKIKDTKFDKDDVVEGLIVCINTLIPERILKFFGQTKVKVLTPELVPDIRAYVIQNFQPWLNKNKDQAKKILKVIYATRDSRKAAERAKVASRAVSKKAQKFISDKYSKPQIYDPEKNFLIVVEGDSAKSTVEKAKTPYTAIFPIRGKLPNAQTTNYKALLENAEVKTLISLINTNIGQKFDIRKLAFKEIIILADADP